MPSWPTCPVSSAAVVAIATLPGIGQHAVIQGTVTSAGPIWGVDDRRFTLQDGSAAVLVRLAAGTPLPAAGERVEVSGTVGHYLGAPELAAGGTPVTLPAGAAVMPRPVGHAPVADRLRWELAVAVGTVVQVRHGLSWRATIRLSDGSHLSVGAGAAAHVTGARVVAGSRLAITGIIRPPVAGSSDPQLYLMARAPADLVVLGTPTSGGAAAGLRATDRPPAAGEPLDAELADLPGLVGRVVRVGGVVIASDASRLIVDDGTAQAVVRLPADAGAPDLPSSGSAVTAIGLVVADPGAGVEIQLRTMADLALASDPGDGPASDDAPAAAAEPSGAAVGPADPVPAAAAAADGILALASAGLVMAAAALVALGLVVVWRRRRAGTSDERWQRRVQDRLASLREPVAAVAPAALGPSPSTPDSLVE
ncbi:MAG: hypothetical protein ACHQZR_06355, partial [Candidatus Limnocylindrales bacterium]